MSTVSTSYTSLTTVAGIFGHYPGEWFVSGGWAIDLFLGRVTRPHSDLEIGVFRTDQHHVRSLLLPDWRLEKVVETAEGPAWVPWYEGECLQLPIHQVKANNAEHSPDEFELFLNELDGGHWWFRRVREIARPRSTIAGRTADGIPFLLPEIQLLYKARLIRDKDRQDFRNVVGLLDEKARAWLLDGLARFLPDHEWISELERRSNGRGQRGDRAGGRAGKR